MRGKNLANANKFFQRMGGFVKVILIFVIFSVKWFEIYSINSNVARIPEIRPIYRTNSVPELSSPITHETRTTTNVRGSSVASTSRTQNRATLNQRTAVSRRLSDDLNEALLSTNTRHFNPTHDGYYASVNRVLVRHGISVLIGSGVGIGVAEIYNRTGSTLSTTTTTPTTTTTTEENEIETLFQ